MLRNSDGLVFATSKSAYLDKIGDRPENRICITVQFDTLQPTLAIVDTGAPWCILNEEQARVLNPDYQMEAIDTRSLNIRGEIADGVLIRLPITLCAEEGEDITIDGTVFVPQDDRDIPNFVGLDGLLNRIKFGVDPQTNNFYFGPIV